MTKEELIALGVKDEVATKIAAAQKKELDGYVEKGKYDLLEAQNKNLDDQVKEHTKQLELLKSKAGDSEAMKKQIADLQAANKKAKQEYANNIKTMHINHAIDTALAGAKAKNVKAVRALLDVDSLEYDEEKGKVLGLTKQINKLTESDDTKFLFDQPADPEKGKPNGGITGNGGNDNDGGQPAGGGSGGSGMSFGEQMAALYNAEHAAVAPAPTAN